MRIAGMVIGARVGQHCEGQDGTRHGGEWHDSEGQNSAQHGGEWHDGAQSHKERPHYERHPVLPSTAQKKGTQNPAIVLWLASERSVSPFSNTATDPL